MMKPQKVQRAAVKKVDKPIKRHAVSVDSGHEVVADALLAVHQVAATMRTVVADADLAKTVLEAAAKGKEL